MCRNLRGTSQPRAFAGPEGLVPSCRGSIHEDAVSLGLKQSSLEGGFTNALGWALPLPRLLDFPKFAGPPVQLWLAPPGHLGAGWYLGSLYDPVPPGSFFCSQRSGWLTVLGGGGGGGRCWATYSQLPLASRSKCCALEQQFSCLDGYCNCPQTSTPVSIKHEEEMSLAATNLYLSSTCKAVLVLSWVLGGKEGLWQNLRPVGPNLQSRTAPCSAQRSRSARVPRRHFALPWDTSPCEFVRAGQFNTCLKSRWGLVRSCFLLKDWRMGGPKKHLQTQQTVAGSGHLESSLSFDKLFQCPVRRAPPFTCTDWLRPSVWRQEKKKKIKLCMFLVLIRMPGESLQVPLFPWSILQHWYCLNIKTGMCSDCKKN